MRTMVILGAGGSIGGQCLDIVRERPDFCRVTAMTMYSRAEALFALAREFRPDICGLVEEPAAIPEDLRGIQWIFGPDVNERVVEAAAAQDVLTAVVGAAGLPVSLAALRVSERLLLANKEALVTGGPLVTELAASLGKPILPVDSEHSAIFQCLRAAEGNPVEKLILTASGGPFRTWTPERMYSATVADVLRHPTWSMGRKITVDSATMVNKGLEIIEASHLYAMPESRIDVLIHPQSIVHSLVEFRDGCQLAQLGVPDMRAPIAYAMSFPARLPSARRLRLQEVGALTFEAPDAARFPAIPLAREALRRGDTAPCIFNAANEVAVAAFLREEIPFGEIVALVKKTMDGVPVGNLRSIGDVREADESARRYAEGLLSVR